jgi:hypothetical protein
MVFAYSSATQTLEMPLYLSGKFLRGGVDRASTVEWVDGQGVRLVQQITSTMEVPFDNLYDRYENRFGLPGLSAHFSPPPLMRIDVDRLYGQFRPSNSLK